MQDIFLSEKCRNDPEKVYFQLTTDSTNDVREMQAKLERSVDQLEDQIKELEKAEGNENGAEKSLKDVKHQRDTERRLLVFLSGLATFTGVKEDRQKIRFLLGDDGFGLMLFSLLELKDPKRWSRLRNTVEMDVRGRTFVKDSTLSITVGEIKSSPEGFSKAKSQLDLRASLIEAAGKVLYPSVTNVTIQKVIYIPADSQKSEIKPLHGYKVCPV